MFHQIIGRPTHSPLLNCVSKSIARSWFRYEKVTSLLNIVSSHATIGYYKYCLYARRINDTLPF